MHKVGSHSAVPELQWNLDTATQGFKKNLKYDGRRTLETTTWEKATISPYNCPLKKTQLRLSRILTKETKNPQTHSCSSSHRRVSKQSSEGPQRCRHSCEKGITPRLSLGSHQALNIILYREKQLMGSSTNSSHPNMCFSGSTKLTRAYISKTVISSCLRFNQKKVFSQ